MKRVLGGLFALFLCIVSAHAAIYGGNRRFIAGGQTQETAALLARMTVQPSATCAANINRLISGLKSTDFLPRLDALYVFKVHTSQAALLNWVSTSHNLTATNSPTFAANSGYTPSGASSGLTGPNLATFGGKYALRNAHVGLYIGTNVSEAAADTASSSVQIQTRNSTLARTRLNDATTTSLTLPVATSIGHVVMSRGGTTYFVAKNGFTFSTVANDATTITSANLTIGFAGGTSSTKLQQAAHYGDAVSQEQVAAAYPFFSEYMTNGCP